MPTEAPFGPRSTRVLRSVTALAGAGLLCLAACTPKSDTQDQAASTTPHDVTLTAAQRQHIRLFTVASSAYHKSIEAAGVVDFDNDQATSVLAPFGGPVTRILVEPGQKVRKGDVLATVQSPDFSEAITTYSKALATAKTTRKIADADQDLLTHNGVSQREAQQAQTDAANAVADRDAALKTLTALDLDGQTIRAIQAGRQMSRVEAKIRAPISGTVVEKLITPGELLQAGSTASFTVANLSRVWVQAQVSDSDLAAVHVGDPAVVETGVGSATLPGKVGNIAALVNPDTRAVTARVDVDNPGGVLRKQMYVRVRINSRQESTGLLVPVSAVLRDDENLPFVYVEEADGSFARRHVTLGYRTGDQYDIPEGLRAGDQVVVDGGLFVQFMQSQ